LRHPARALFSARYLGLDALKEAGLRLPVEMYFKAGLRDGPTSARFAVVDYDSTSNTPTPPAVWDRKANCYRKPDGTPLNGNTKDLFSITSPASGPTFKIL
jgi:hypothetical protein